MTSISITKQMYEDIKDLESTSQITIVMAYISYFYVGNIESFELSELEQYILNKWIDEELSH